MATHKTESPRSTIATRIAQVLKSRKYRRENRSVVAVLALAVVLGVAIVLMQRGLAKKYTVRVLDCHYIGNVAHTHNQDCYDDSGNLICPLRERELHVHDESCFDDQGNLICGKDELVEEHVHGDGCFKTIMTDTPPASDESGLVATGTAKGEVESPEQAEEPNPAMNFSHTFVDADDKPVLAVEVNAPAGALPKDATMEAAWVAPYDVSREDVQHAVSTVTAGKVLDLQAVDITFYDGAHNEIEPEKDVTVTFTSDMLANTKEEARIVHIESDDEAAKRDKDAEPQTEIVKTITQGDLGEDQVAFASNQFSKYVIALVSSKVSVTATGDLADGSSITVDAPAGAGLSQNLAINAVQYGPGDGEYKTLVDSALDAANVEESTYTKVYDIKLVDGDETVQPQVPVLTSISLNDLPADASLAVAHCNQHTQTAEIVNSWIDGDDIVFEAESFSPYVVIEIDQDADPDPDAGTGTLFVNATLKAADNETNLQDFINSFTFKVEGSGKNADGSDLDIELPLEIEENQLKTTTVSDLPSGTYTVSFSLDDTDEYNVEIELDPSDGKVTITDDGRESINAEITIGRKPSGEPVGGAIDIAINKTWETVGGQQMSWPSDADPMVELRRVKSTNGGRTWAEDTSYEPAPIVLNRNGATQLYSLPLEDEDEANVAYKYYLYETQVPNGYRSTIKVGSTEVASYDKGGPSSEQMQALRDAAVANSSTFNLVNVLTGSGDSIDLTVHVDWANRDDSAATPPSGTAATFELHRAVSTDQGVSYTEDDTFTDKPTVTISNQDETFTGLPIMNADGTELYKYYAKEIGIPDGWQPVYIGKNGSDTSVMNLIADVATDQSRTQTVKNQKVVSVDVPVVKEWPDFDPSVHSGATWSAEFQLERAELPEGSNTPSAFAVIDTTKKTLTNDGTLVYQDLPVYRYDANGNSSRLIYSVKEVGYSATRSDKTATWDGTGTPEYYPLFIQDAGDPEVAATGNFDRWYRIILSNTESKLQAPSKETTIDLKKVWNIPGTASEAEFELVRYVQESYRDWSNVSGDDMDDQSGWKPASLTFNGNASTTIDLPNNAPVYVVVDYPSDVQGSDSKVTITYTDLQGNTQTTEVERTSGNGGTTVASAAIYPAIGSSGVRDIAISGAGVSRASNIRVSDVAISTNTPVQDAIISILEMGSDNAQTVGQGQPATWTGKFVNHHKDDSHGSEKYKFPLEQAEPMNGRHQTVYNYSYYVRETSSTPRSTPTITVGGEVNDSGHRIDVSNGSAVTVDVSNRPMAQFSVVVDWVDAINAESRYPSVFFTLYQQKKNTSGGQIYTDPSLGPGYFENIELNIENNFRWQSPIELPRYNASGEEVEYYVILKSVSANEKSKAYTEPSYSNNYIPNILDYKAYSGFTNQINYANYTTGNTDQPYQASVHATAMPSPNSSANAIGGEIAIRVAPPHTDQIDMLKKKWFDWKENPGGAAPSLDAGENFNLNSCIVEFMVIRRALDESHSEFNAAYNDAYYSGGALVKDWSQWYHNVYQGWDDQGHAYNSVPESDFTLWVHRGLWNWNLNNQGGGGLEYRGYEMVNGVQKPVTYQYIFIETGLWKYREEDGKPVFDTPFREDYEYYAALPASWGVNGQVELFPKIVAQDQDRITNLVGSNLIIEKAWGASEDLRDLEEVYLKVYYKGNNQDKFDFTNAAAGEVTTVVTNTGIVDRSRFRKIGDEYYLCLRKGETSLLLSNLPMGTSKDDLFRYWVEECGWRDADGQDHMNVSRFNPTYAAWNPSTGSWGADSTNPQNASIILGKKDDNRIQVDNTPSKKVKIRKRWQDENGADTTAWKSEVTYTIERQAKRYSNIGTQDEPRFVQDIWYTPDNGETWYSREEFNHLSPADQADCEASAAGVQIGNTFMPNAWEKLTFNGNDKLSLTESPILYNVKASSAGSTSYTATTGMPDSSDAPSGATKWYDVVDGLAESFTEDTNNDGKIDYEYRYTYRVTEVTKPDQGCCVIYEPTSGSLSSGEATIINAKNSLRVIKRWYDGNNNELEGPWDNTLKVKYNIKVQAQDWVFNAVTNLWKEDPNNPTPYDAGTVTEAGPLEITQENQIIVATPDTTDQQHATYSFGAPTPTSDPIGGKDKWAMRVDGLESEYEHVGPNNERMKTTFTYLVEEEEIPGAITTYSPHPTGDESVGRVTNGRQVEIRNRKNPLEIKPEKVFTGMTENDIFEADATDPSIKHVKAPLSDINLKLENTTTPLPAGVVSAVVFDDTIGNLYDGGLLTYAVDANDPTKITFSATVKPGASFPNYHGTLHLDAIVTGASFKFTETGADTHVPSGYKYSTNGAVTEKTKNSASDAVDNTLTLALENPYKKLAVTAKKVFTGIDINDFIETDDSTTPPTERVKAPLKDITLKLINESKSKTIFEDTIGNLFAGGVITHEYDQSLKKLTLSIQITSDSNFANYQGTIDKSQIFDGDTYKLTEGGAATHVPAGYQFRAADATGEDSDTPATSGNDEGKLTLELANPYNEIKIHVEKKFTGLDDIFDGVTNAKIVDDYDNLDAGVKKVLEGVKLSLKNTTKSTATTEVYVFQNKSLKELIQSGVLAYDGTAFKVAGDITKASAGINLDALVGGCEYELTESGADLAASIPDGYVFIAGESKTSDKKTLDATTAQLSVDCENKYIPTIDVKVYKVPENAGATGPDTTATPLEGATFVLEKGEFVTDQTSGDTTWSKTGEITVTETSTKGIFDVTGLEAGTYKLVEHDVPNGYIKYDYDPIFNVVYNTQTKMLELSEVTTDPVTGKDIAKASEVVVDTTSNEVRLYVANPPGEELPHSGGPGTLPMTLAGIALLASASLYLLKAQLKKGLNLHKIG